MERDRYLAAYELRTIAFEHRASQLLDKQRHSAGALDDRRHGFIRQGVACGYLSDHHAHAAHTQPG